jgi:ATP:ADP antiporter, AAA family
MGLRSDLETRGTPRSVLVAMFGAAAVTAQFVSGKAVRDALFLTSLDLTALPAMLIATSACSMLLVVANARMARRIAPATLVPAMFAASGLLFLLEWAVRTQAPLATAVALYLHISGAGPVLASGFWLMASERFDPHTARKRYGHIAAAGTLGGLLSALATERVAALFGVPAMLPLLAALQFSSAWFIRSTAVRSADARIPAALDPVPAASRSAVRVLSESPYLRNLAALVLLGTTGAALVDYLFKAQAIDTFGRGDNLLRFFALYYAGTALVAFLLQTSASRMVLERFGVAVSAGTPAGAVLAGSLAGLVAPGFGSLLMARGGEAVFRSSFFRAGYELFYTPIPAGQKRAAKTLIDVGFDRLGDGVGGGLVRLAVLLAPASQASAILLFAITCSTAALVAASRLRRGYLGTLERSLADLSGGAGSFDPADARTTLSGIRPARLLRRQSATQTRGRQTQGVSSRTVPETGPLDPELRDIVSLRSRNRTRVIEVLSREEGLSAGLIPHAITLLAWDQVTEHAVFALRKVAEEHIGQLVDALIDPNQEFAIRRRLARVFSICVSQRAATGLMLGLGDSRFDVRYQSARSLSAIVEKNPSIQIPSSDIFTAVLRELAVGRGVWESRRLLDGVAAGDNRSPLDRFVRTRAGESLAHVFTLLSIVLPREPLQMAFQSLQSAENDERREGTALEYLESVLPPAIRARLWPFIERRPAARSAEPARPREKVIADLLRSNHSIVLNLEELRLGSLTTDSVAP